MGNPCRPKGWNPEEGNNLGWVQDSPVTVCQITIIPLIDRLDKLASEKCLYVALKNAETKKVSTTGVKNKSYMITDDMKHVLDDQSSRSLIIDLYVIDCR